MTENTIYTVKIAKIIEECKDVKTIIFNMNCNKTEYNITPKPGQFLMIWVPGVDEIPMSISGCDNNGNWAITVKIVGECTDALCKLKIGDYIGVRGPLGNYFKLPNDNSKKVILIGGGIGIAPLKFLSSELKNKKIRHTIIVGAKIDKEVIFLDDFQDSLQNNINVYFCTDDGSYGTQGNASEIFKEMVKEFNKTNNSNLIIYSCGPEIMLNMIFKICQKHNYEFYASLERIMRCGCGLCGLCAIDPLGSLVCKDGPIFNSDDLSKMADFGKFKRDITGKKIPL
ncbi:MAG: dihydroorotate dehydrogenase electron transfer subunit [Candidatus Odinarchaeota archaeon]